MGVKALNTRGFTTSFSPPPPPSSVKEEGAIQISVENALLTWRQSTPTPTLPLPGGGSECVLDEREREWRNEHRSVKFELMTSVQVLRTNRY